MNNVSFKSSTILVMYLGSNRCCDLPVNKTVVGSPGYDGFYGPIGTIGLTGSTGVTGYQGATGLCYRGYKGPQGVIGPQGGTIGPQGFVGPAGTTGSRPFMPKNVSFTMVVYGSYNSDDDTDLTTLGTPTPSNNVVLNAGSYAISWEVNESWSDLFNQFYVRFYKSSQSVYEYPTVFIFSKPAILYSTNYTIYGIGNDLFIASGGNYTIELLQTTTNTTPIILSNQNINFSITFVPIL